MKLCRSAFFFHAALNFTGSAPSWPWGAQAARLSFLATRRTLFVRSLRAGFACRRRFQAGVRVLDQPADLLVHVVERHHAPFLLRVRCQPFHQILRHRHNPPARRLGLRRLHFDEPIR